MALIEDSIMTEAMVKQAVEALRDVTNVQCSDGNWNHDPYMHGMANGLLLALSFFEAGKVEFLEAPDEWLEDSPSTFAAMTVAD